MSELHRKPCFIWISECQVLHVCCRIKTPRSCERQTANCSELAWLSMLSSFSGKPTGMPNESHCLGDTLKLLDSGKPNECKCCVFFCALKGHCSTWQKNMLASSVAPTSFSSPLLYCMPELPVKRSKLPWWSKLCYLRHANLSNRVHVVWLSMLLGLLNTKIEAIYLICFLGVTRNDSSVHAIPEEVYNRKQSVRHLYNI